MLLEFSPSMFALIFGVLVFLVAGVWIWKRQKSASSIEERPQPQIDSTLAHRLKANRDGWIGRISGLLTGAAVIDEALYEQMEEVLITADLGVKTTQTLLANVRKKAKARELNRPEVLKNLLKEEITAILQLSDGADLAWEKHKPFVLVIVGVNGVGKTTTLGKLALSYVASGKKVLVGACDTFRAAAVEQLKVWCERAQVDVISQADAAPSAVAFDAAAAAKARGVDLLIVDTAGRQHTKVNLMEELKKTLRSLAKPIEGAPHAIWLVLDATTGQTALEQARTFHRELEGLSGIIVTKMDGTAKGGIIVALADELKIPIRFIGVGEKIDDLRPFDRTQFADALFD